MNRQLTNTQIVVPDDMIHFGIGQPGPSVLPVDLMKQASDHCLTRGDPLMLNYGPEQGDGPFLEALAGFLSPAYGFSVDPLSLMVVGGASHALDIVATFFTQPGDIVVVEEPTYFLAHRIFRDYGLEIVTVPVDEDGLIVEALAEILTHHKPAFVYTIPVYQNPSGVTLSAKRRQQLVELSEQHDFLILADEVYQLLNYTDTPPPPLAAMTETERVLSIGSFSKIWGPGLRLGWIQAGPKTMDRLIQIQFIYSGGSLNQYTSHVMRSAIELGLQQSHLDHLKSVYRSRIDALSDALGEKFGSTVTFRKPQGGFFLWMTFPEQVDVAQFQVAAETNNVGFQPGVNFSCHGDLNHHMRLCFARYESHELIEGVSRLAQTFEDAVSQ